MAGFTRQAKAKLSDMDNLTIIGVTASYGKTSIKNIIAHILEAQHKTYATPRSVNTLSGVIKDINVDLPADTEVYVVEMGARGEGDIAEIAHLINEHYAVVGKIGPAHIEYFKTMENIRNTKMEILQSDRLREAWVHISANVKPAENIHIYGDDIKNIEATLEGTSFTLDGTRYTASLLGAFNAENIAAAILIAQAMGIDEETIKQRLSTLRPVDHRLQRIDAGGKVILDDSFNGNIDGMMASFDLASTYQGRKVVITPGLIEADDELNEQVAHRANEVFDLVIVTGELNYPIFKRIVDADKIVKLDSKAQMEQMLINKTKAGDLILFANDAPSFV
jgi:UDP-N-acetylmuramoyl-tripeptide--D-alanyl-D-alanine ligase